MPEILDLERGIAACAGNHDLHAQVAGLLASDLDARLNGLFQAMTTNDAVEAGRLAHKHKGACLAVGAIALAELFATIEQACRDGDHASAQAAVERLPAEATAYRAAVAGLQ